MLASLFSLNQVIARHYYFKGDQIHYVVVTPIGHCQKVTDQPKPREISYGGGVVTIYGEGFSADTFSQFNATKGNKIYFTNNFERVECINPVDQVFKCFYSFRITGICC